MGERARTCQARRFPPHAQARYEWPMPPNDQAAKRKARLAAALRENLRRRKAVTSAPEANAVPETKAACAEADTEK
jgi:hypothetical protein